MTVPALATLPSSSPSVGRRDAADLGTAIQANMLAELRTIDAELRRRRHPHRAIHAVRRAVRRFRSMLALCVGVAPEEFEAIDRRVRRVGKRLSALRDAHVLVLTASRLRRGDGRDIWRLLDRWLRRERRRLLAQSLADDPDFAALLRRVHRAARDLAKIDFEGLSGDAIVRALRASAADMASAERKANAHPREALRHRWRRRVRRLRLQLEGLAVVADDRQLPAAVRVEAQWVLAEALNAVPSAAALAVLADRLGDQQDERHLAATVRRQDALPFRDEILAALTTPFAPN